MSVCRKHYHYSLYRSCQQCRDVAVPIPSLPQDPSFTFAPLYDIQSPAASDSGTHDYGSSDHHSGSSTYDSGSSDFSGGGGDSGGGGASGDY